MAANSDGKRPQAMAEASTAVRNTSEMLCTCEKLFEQQPDAEGDGNCAGAAEIVLDAEWLGLRTGLDRFGRNGTRCRRAR